MHALIAAKALAIASFQLRTKLTCQIEDDFVMFRVCPGHSDDHAVVVLAFRFGFLFPRQILLWREIFRLS